MFGKSKAVTKEITFDELLERKRNLDSEIASRQEAEVENLKTKLNAVASALGVAVTELIGIKPDAEPRRRKPLARIKYRDPGQHLDGQGQAAEVAARQVGSRREQGLVPSSMSRAPCKTLTAAGRSSAAHFCENRDRTLWRPRL